VEILEADVAKIDLQCSEVMTVVRDGLLTKPSLAPQIREETRHAVGERLVVNTTTGMPDKPGHNQSKHFLDGPPNLADQSRARRTGGAPVIRAADPRLDEWGDV
jgi:hypothetical protein